MKINLSQLESHLGTTLASVYLICGDDPIQKYDAIQLIRKAAKRSGFTERIRLAPDSGLEEDQLYTALYSPSLSADKTLLELDFRGKLPGKAITGILEGYLSNPATSLMIVIDADKLEDTATRSAWYKALEKSGMVVTIWPIAREQLPQWIMNRAKKYKMTIQTDAAALLTDYVEGNLAAAAQTLEKIYLLKPEKAIDAELIQSILSNESSYTVFDLTEALLAGPKARVLTILEALRLDGTEAPIVLWGITREIRILADIAAAREAGHPIDDLLKKHRIFPRRQPLIKRFLSRFNPADYPDCLRLAASIDSMIKGAIPGNTWEALQMLCLKLV